MDEFEKITPCLKQQNNDSVASRILELAKFLRCDLDKTLSVNGLFAGQDHVLLSIVHCQGITPGQLAKELNVSSATISVSIKRLEKTGFIEKKDDENDARTTHLYTTKKANDISEHIREHFEKQEAMLIAGMTQQEKQCLLKLLDEAIYNSYAARGGEKIGRN